MSAELRAKLWAKKQARATAPRSAITPSPDTSGTRPQHPNSRANLIPVKKGQILNPEGKNQYSAGQAYRDKLDEVWLQDALNRAEEIKAEDHPGVMCLRCGLRACNIHLGFDIYTHSACLPALENLTPIELCALQERCLSLRGDSDARGHLRKTFNPASKLLELSTNPDKPFQVTTITRKIIE